MSYVSNYFDCCIQLEGLLYDVERDLLAIAKFLVTITNNNNRGDLIMIY